MSVHDFSDPSHTRLASIVTQILELENRMSRPDQQSIYFGWAVENHSDKLLTLRRQYDDSKHRFNDHTVDDFQEELNNKNKKLGRVNTSLAAGIIRSIAISALQFKVAEIEAMIQLKGLVSELPEFGELSTNSVMWKRILESLYGDF